MSGLFSSESVAAGHPDKLCDRISDAVLDAFLAVDRDARVACEAAAGPGWVRVFGEVRSEAAVDVERVVRAAIRRAGFTRVEDGLDPDGCDVQLALVQQSPEIASGVDRSLEARAGSVDPRDLLGAGDQGLMFGYACSETPERMPLSVVAAHRIVEALPRFGLGPDGKAQVTVEYVDGVPVPRTALVSVQHPSMTVDGARSRVYAVVEDVLGYDVTALVNPAGSWTLGGPAADAGLTGRKIIVDTYGGAARHGGGAFSGKDPSKVDRSAAYALRRVARTVVDAGLASRCEVQASYAIGVARPVGLQVETFGTGAVADSVLAAKIADVFDLRPAVIIEELGLRDGVRYEPLTVGGHFGRAGLPWERDLPLEQLLAA